jgi:hypothetical protein
VLKDVAREARQPVLRRAAEQASRAPRPLTKAPALFRLNGFGTGLYGHGDTGSDGSYVATYCLSALWVPVLPLAAYRVRKLEDGRYLFLAKEGLGRFARSAQVAVVVLAVGTAALAGLQSWLRSPSRLARVAFAEAQALEARGDVKGATDRHRAAIAQHGGNADVKPAAQALLRLTAASVPRPCTPESLGVIGRVVAAYDKLPGPARAGAPLEFLSRELLRWSDEMGAKGPGEVRAGLSVLDLAERVVSGSDRATVRQRRARLNAALADALLAADRPLDALVHYGQLGGDARARAASEGIISGFGPAPSLWIEAESQVEAWCAAAPEGPERERAEELRRRLAEARAASARDRELLQAGDPRAVAAAFARAPADQELGVAMAELRRSAGDAKGCLAVLDGLGPAGRLTADAQQLRGGCLADAGDLARADEGLSALLQERLPPFQRARRDYEAAATQLQERLAAEAERGALPPDVKRALESAKEADQGEIFRKWLSERMSKDARLASLRTEYMRHGAVVPASLTLGSVKLRRASEAAGAARQAHLDAAERAFLSIREEAEGAPEYHLGFGQVLYRLGRPAEGDKELNALLGRGEPVLTLRVAEAYRELGITARARDITEKLYESASENEVKWGAAFARAHVPVDQRDEDLWLRRSDPSSPEVKRRLLESQATRLLADGKRAEAERTYAQVAALLDRDATHNPVAANNAAVAWLGRYAASGDPAHLRGAVSRLESAARLVPDDAIVLGNLRDALAALGEISVLERWVHTRTLIIGSSDAHTLLGQLAAGSLRDEVLRAISAEPSFRRALDVGRQEQVLAPQKSESYALELWWLRRSSDVPGLQALAARLQRVPAIDSSDRAHARRRWVSKEGDAERRADAEKHLSRARERLARAERERHAPTLAAAHALLADSLGTMTYFSPREEAFREAVEACRKARQLWPEAGLEPALAEELTQLAAWSALPASPALKKAWDAQRRVLPLYHVLDRAAAGPAQGEVRGALRARPEFREAVGLLHSSAARQPDVDEWVYARLAGDAALEALAAPALSRADLRLANEIDVRLDPGDERDKADLDLLRAGGSQ